MKQDDFSAFGRKIFTLLHGAREALVVF